jgi:molybdate transport system substrate-binding protein
VPRLERWIPLVGLAIVLAAAGCGGKTAPSSAAAGGAGESGAPAATTLEVMVPCGQVGPFSEIVKTFQAQNPGVEVDWIPENMVTITRKLLDGKVHPDVTLSMGDLEMNLVEKAGLLLDGTRVKYAENSLAIMVPTANPAGVKTFKDLAKPAVKTITIPDPKENSVGVHAVEALKNAGVWSQVEKKVVYAQFAADSKDVAAKGKAEASIGYYPCAVEVHIPDQPPAKPKNLQLLGQVSPDLYPAFDCEGAVLKDSKHPEEAKKLLALLATPESQEIFKKWEFKADGATCPTG